MAQIKIYHGKKGDTYQITVYNGYDINGKQIKLTTTYKPDKEKSKRQQAKDAEIFAIEFEKKVKLGQYFTGEKISFEEFTYKWLEEYAEKHYAKSTLYSYKGHLKNIILPNLGHYKMSYLTPIVIQKFYNELIKEGARIDEKEGGYKRGSIIKFHKIITSIMKRAVLWQVIEKNPCDNVEIPLPDNEVIKVKHFTLEQANKFLELLDSPKATQYTAYYPTYEKSIIKNYTAKVHDMNYRLMYKTLFRLALFSGMRIGEIEALTWNDINFDTQTICISKSVAYGAEGTFIKTPKTKSSYREVVIPIDEIKLLKKMKTNQKELILKLGSSWVGYTDRDEIDNNYVFCQWNGKNMAKGSANRILQRIINNYNNTVIEKEQLPVISVHGLRHTSAT